MRILLFLPPAVLVVGIVAVCEPGPGDASADIHRRMHEAVVDKFVATPGSGLERMGQTLQFIAARVPAVESIELVGVALHDSPVVYVDDSDKTRPLNAIARVVEAPRLG